MTHRILYQCPKCGKRHVYQTRSQIKPKKPRTHCQSCKKLIYVVPFVEQARTKFHKNHKSSKKSIQKKVDKKTPKLEIGGRNNTTKIQTSKVSKNKIKSKNNFRNFGLDLYRETEASLSPKKKIFRNHFYRWKISIEKLPIHFKFNEKRTVFMGKNRSWVKKFRLFKKRGVDLEAHLGTKRPCLIFNLTQDNWNDLPDVGKQTYLFAWEFAGYLQRKFDFLLGQDLQLCQPNHNAAIMNNFPEMKNCENCGPFRNELGSIHIDRSKDKSGQRNVEMELIGPALVQAILDAPKQIYNLQRMISQMIVVQTATIKTLAKLTGTSSVQDKEQKTRDSSEYETLWI